MLFHSSRTTSCCDHSNCPRDVEVVPAGLTRVHSLTLRVRTFASPCWISVAKAANKNHSPITSQVVRCPITSSWCSIAEAMALSLVIRKSSVNCHPAH
jgi:hypothetical protein